MPVTIRKASCDDVKPLANALAAAFALDPVVRWLIPAERALSRLQGLFAMELLRLYLPHDEVYTTRDLVGGAVWSPPRCWQASTLSVVRALPRLTWTLRSRMGRALRAVKTIEGLHPREAHWYLAVLGTRPEHQRRGIGSALLGPVLDRCDHEYLPAYLESSTEDHVAFYGRLGFEVIGRIDLPEGGPSVWPMWREPRP